MFLSWAAHELLFECESCHALPPQTENVNKNIDHMVLLFFCHVMIWILLPSIKKLMWYVQIPQSCATDSYVRRYAIRDTMEDVAHFRNVSIYFLFWGDPFNARFSDGVPCHILFVDFVCLCNLSTDVAFPWNLSRSLDMLVDFISP